MRAYRHLRGISLIIILVALAAVCLPGTAASAPKKLAVRVLQSDSQHLRMHVTMPSVRFAPMAYGDGTNFSAVIVAEGLPFSEVGCPDIPVIRKLAAVPMSDDITLEYRLVRQRTERGVTVVPRALEDGMPRATAPRVNIAAYASKLAFPREAVCIDRVSNVRGQRIAIIDVFPVQFLAGDNAVLVTEEVEITLTFVNPRGPVISNVGPMEKLLGSTLVNRTKPIESESGAPGGRIMQTPPPGTVCWPTGTDLELIADQVSACGTDYLIIMADEIDQALVQQLAERRATENGFNVSVVKMSQIDASPDTIDTPETIRDLLHDVYDDQSAAHMADGYLGYVLLVGDAHDRNKQILLPSHYYQTGRTLPIPRPDASDAYYSFLDDDPGDILSDVFLGRIPANAIDGSTPNLQMQNVLNKILTYGRSEDDDFKNLLVTGDLAGVNPGTPEEYQQVVDEYVPSYVQKDNLHRKYFAGGDQEFSSAVANSINANGYWLVSIYGHANPMYFAHAFFNSHYGNLANSVLPVFFLGGCDAGMFDNTAGIYGCQQSPPFDACDAVAEVLLVQEHGAIGVLGFTVTSSFFNQFRGFYRAIFRDYAYSLGEILQYIRLNYFDDLSAKFLTLFGDPALNIMWEEGAVDAVDLAVRPANMMISGWTKKTYYNDVKHAYVDACYVNGNVPAQLEATIENLGSETAPSVAVHIWSGYPNDPGSDLLTTINTGPLEGFGDTMAINYNLGILPDGEHEIYIELGSDGSYGELTERNNVAGITFYSYDYVTGFPVPVSTGITSVLDLAVADLTGTSPGKETIITATSGTGWYQRCFRSDGTVLWEYPVVPTLSETPANIGNIYGNGKAYSAIIDGNRILILDAENGQLAQSIPLAEGSYYKPGQKIILADIMPDDDAMEIIVTRCGQFNINYVEAYSTHENNGTFLLWSIYVSYGQDYSVFSAGDINGDGDQEIVIIMRGTDVNNGFNVITAIDAPNTVGGSPTILWTQRLIGSEPRAVIPVQSQPDEARLDILASGGASTYQVSRINYNDGSIEYQNGQVLSNQFMPRFTAGDVDNDGSLEIIAVAGNTLWVLFAENGQAEHSYVVNDAEKFMSVPLTADIDGDDALEIVAAYRAQVDGLLKLQVFDENAVPIGSPMVFPTMPTVTEQAMALEDIDAEGRYEILFIGLDRVFQVIRIGDVVGRKGWTQKFKDPSQTNLLEQPLKGTYTKSVSLAGDVRILDAVHFQGPRALVDCGTEVRVQDGGGVVANGELKVHGSAISPVRFSSAVANPGPGAWSSIHLAPGAQGYVGYCDIRHSQSGIVAEGDVTIDNSVIANGSAIGIQAIGNIQATIRNSRVQSHAGGGILLDGCDATSQLYNVTVRGNPVFGAKIKNVAESLGVDSCLIVGNSDCGVICEGANPEISDCVIDSNQAGVLCKGGSNPIIGHCTIRYNVDGVDAFESSYPKMGEGPVGGNNIISNNSHMHVVNLNEDQTDPIFAQYDYWGKSTGPKPNKFMGNVDYQPFLSSPPFVPWHISPLPEEKAAPVTYRFGTVYPNPFNPTTTIQYEVPEPGGSVSISIYNVVGQRVVDLVNRFEPAGSHSIAWDGRDARGRAVESGVYFVRMVAGGFAETKKIVLMR